VHYQGNVIFLVYVDDGILISPDKNSILDDLVTLQSAFTISVEGTLNDYVCVNIRKTSTIYNSLTE
jgi:hypothetical protein